MTPFSYIISFGVNSPDEFVCLWCICFIDFDKFLDLIWLIFKGTLNFFLIKIFSDFSFAFVVLPGWLSNLIFLRELFNLICFFFLSWAYISILSDFSSLSFFFFFFFFFKPFLFDIFILLVLVFISPDFNLINLLSDISSLSSFSYSKLCSFSFVESLVNILSWESNKFEFFSSWKATIVSSESSSPELSYKSFPLLNKILFW